MLVILDIETKGIILSRQRITKTLIRLRGCAGWSASLFFAYGINMFSHDVAHLYSSTYNDICTLLDQMEKENWAGVMGGLATQVKKMLTTQGVDATQCPFPAQSLRIENYDLHLPEVPSVLSSFAAVSSLFHFASLQNYKCLVTGQEKKRTHSDSNWTT